MAKLVAMVSIYNSGDWLENRIQNLLDSNLRDMEIWCVNANSPDPRDHEIPQKYPVKYVRLEERITVYETWNYIIQNSDSKYLVNANTDDIVSPDCYTILSKILDANRKVGFAYPSWYVTSVPSQSWNNKHSFSSDGKPGNYAGDVERAGVGHFPMWRRSLHDELQKTPFGGYFDPQFKALGDADWWARCWWVAKTKFFWVNQCLGMYLWRDGENLWNKSITPQEWEVYHQRVREYRQ